MARPPPWRGDGCHESGCRIIHGGCALLRQPVLRRRSSQGAPIWGFRDRSHGVRVSGGCIVSLLGIGGIWHGAHGIADTAIPNRDWISRSRDRHAAAHRSWLERERVHRGDRHVRWATIGIGDLVRSGNHLHDAAWLQQHRCRSLVGHDWHAKL